MRTLVFSLHIFRSVWHWVLDFEEFYGGVRSHFLRGKLLYILNLTQRFCSCTHTYIYISLGTVYTLTYRRHYCVVLFYNNAQVFCFVLILSFRNHNGTSYINDRQHQGYRSDLVKSCASCLHSFTVVCHFRRSRWKSIWRKHFLHAYI